jgi:hypothetical protein
MAMFARKILLGFVFCLLSVLLAHSAEPPLVTSDPASITSYSHGVTPGLLKSARVDSLILIGPWNSGAQVNGQFQNQAGEAAWNDWTHRDLTEPDGIHWQISTYEAANLGENPDPDNLALWCGSEDFTSCGEEDPAGGYGNNWIERIQWTRPVFQPGLPAQVHLTAHVNVDTEPGYDFFFLEVLSIESPLEILTLEGQYSNHLIDVTFTVDPEDFQGLALDEVGLQFRFRSDGAWSDEDCLFPTRGAVQIDNIAVTLTQGEDSFTDLTDFETGLGSWKVIESQGVGDFTQIWTGLQDADPCGQNLSPQVAFIDDGLVVPGVGPSVCLDWCYGPYGYIVNNTGGRIGETLDPSRTLKNVLESPIVAWPADGLAGGLLEFDVYRHEPFTGDSPGIFYIWEVRSTSSDDPEAIALEDWMGSNLVYHGGPDYKRDAFSLNHLLVPGCQYAQVRLGVWDLGYIFNQFGANGTPAPYFDNVRLTATEVHGPSLYASEVYLGQDAFPAQGYLNLEDLGTNSVRFDMARDVNFFNDNVIDPGDSVVMDVASVRSGAELVGDVLMHYRLRPNPVFDPYRTSGLPNQGTVTGVPASQGTYTIEGRFAFDLPDENFLFPGDVLHYYFSATDDDGLTAQTATLPADTTGFSDFTDPLAYDTSFVVRALPSVRPDDWTPGVLTTAHILFWNDFAKGGGQAEWHRALINLGARLGYDLDVYYTNSPGSGLGNGLGGRATPALLGSYDVILYSSGTLSLNNLENEGSADAGGNDVALLDAWLRQGGKNLLLTGDSLVQSLAWGQNSAPDFLDQWLGVELIDPNIRPLIHNMRTPLVQAIPGNGVLPAHLSWVAFGGCPTLNKFDAVVTQYAEGAIQLAEFLPPGGNPGAYPYAAATLMPNLEFDAKVISMPYDFSTIYNAPGGDKDEAPLPTRVKLLEDFIASFGYIHGGWYAPVPAAESFALDSYPNPFNPSTRIAYTMPRAGHLSLKVFDVKGRLVKTLIDQHQETSGHVVWEGMDDRGHKVGSGVYFAEARTAGQVLVQKMLMVK